MGLIQNIKLTTKNKVSNKPFFGQIKRIKISQTLKSLQTHF